MVRIMLSDIDIANNSKILNIKDVASKLDIPLDYLEYYGNDKAKIDLKIYKLGHNHPILYKISFTILSKKKPWVKAFP